MQIQQNPVGVDSIGEQQATASVDRLPIDNVADIQKAYAAITALAANGKLDSTSFKYDCSGEKGGTVTYYTNNGNLTLISHRYNEYSHYEAEVHYFVQNQNLFFAFQKEMVWSFDSGPEGATKDRVTERRIYVVAGQAVKCLEKKYEIRKHANVNPDPASVANHTKDCNLSKPQIVAFKRLKTYWKSRPPECLDMK